jgi:capsular polysaccharide biosynthesis protein
MDSQAAVAAIRSRLRLIVVIAVLSGVVALVVSLVIPPTYESETTLLVGSPTSADYEGILAAQLQAQTYAELATTKPVLDAAALKAGTTGDEILEDVTVQTPRSTPFVTILARDADPARAAAIASAIADELIDYDSAVGETVFGLTVVDPALVPEEPATPRPLVNAAAAGFAGLVIGVVFAWMLERPARSSLSGERSSGSRQES